jgi:hypothetical protein
VTDTAEARQLDLFVDGRDAFLVHEVVTALESRETACARAALGRLRDEHPAHPDLRALAALVDGLDAPVPAPLAHATLASRVEAIQRDLVPAARRFCAAPDVLRPLWQALATAAASLPFDAARPRAHAGWLHQQCDDWAAVRVAVEREPGWAATPLLRHWLGLARHHLGEPEVAIRLWLPLCWMDPALFAEHAPMLPNAILRNGWETFDRAVPFIEFLAEAAQPATWFPAWLLARHRGLAHLFAAEDIPATGPDARAFRALLALAPLESRGLSDELVARRRALREVSPEFFTYYMGTVRRGR